MGKFRQSSQRWDFGSQTIDAAWLCECDSTQCLARSGIEIGRDLKKPSAQRFGYEGSLGGGELNLVISGVLSDLARCWFGWGGGDPEEPTTRGAQELVDGAGRHGSGEQKALGPVATEFGECLELCFPFDALGDHGEADSFGERHDPPDEASPGLVVVKVPDEGPVDLDLVDREVSKPGQ